MHEHIMMVECAGETLIITVTNTITVTRLFTYILK